MEPGLILPKIVWKDFDYWRMWETVLGLVTVGLGNWMVAKDFISYGLLVATMGALLVAHGTIGWAESKLAVLSAGREIIQSVLEQEKVKAALSEKFDKYQADLRKIDIQLRNVKGSVATGV